MKIKEILKRIGFVFYNATNVKKDGLLYAD